MLYPNGILDRLRRLLIKLTDVTSICTNVILCVFRVENTIVKPETQSKHISRVDNYVTQLYQSILTIK